MNAGAGSGQPERAARPESVTPASYPPGARSRASHTCIMKMIMVPRALRAAARTRPDDRPRKEETPVLSLHTGYDTAYLTDAVGGADYYTGAAGEPPGYWQGAGAGALGLAGQVDADDDAGAVPRGHRAGRPGAGPQAATGELPGGRGIAAQADRGRGRRRGSRSRRDHHAGGDPRDPPPAARAVAQPRPVLRLHVQRAQVGVGALGVAPGCFGRSTRGRARSRRGAARGAGRADPRGDAARQ